MSREVEKVEETNMETLAMQAELEAAADQVASPKRESVSEPEETEDAENAEANRLTVDFTRKYEFDGKTYDSIDLSGLVDLTTEDLELFDRVLIRLDHRPQNKFNDTTYAKHVAMKVTKLPVEFFNQLGLRDMLIVVGVIHSYFLFG